MLVGLAVVAGLSSLQGEGMSTYDLRALLESVRAEYKLPAMAAAIVMGERVFASDAVGVRKLGSDVPVKVTDKFHIGSCTKSFTATLAAMLVEDGKLRWDTKIIDVFPTVPVNAALQGVTIDQLLAHRSGIRGDLNDADMDRYVHTAMKPMDQRSEVMAKLLPEAPENTPGSTFSYSNLGVTVAGSMIEHLVGKPWEQLVSDRIFKPLGMKSAGFGAPAKPGEVDQPWGHLATDAGAYEPVPPGPEADNPPAIGPAATVHSSVLDLAKYAEFYLNAAKGQSSLLTKQSFDRLASDPYGQNYGLGWLVVERSWTKGPALTHGGSNTMFYTVIWIAPGQDFAIIVATNAGGDNAKLAADKVVHNTVTTLFNR